MTPSPSPKLSRAGWNGRAVLWIALTIAILWLSGLWLHHDDALGLAELTPAQMQSQHAASVVHGVFAWVSCVVAGRWVWPHVALIFACRKKRWIWIAGLLVAAAGAIVALTGLGLLYGAADWREKLSATHWALGLGWPLLFVLHGWRAVARLALPRTGTAAAPRREAAESGAASANIPRTDA